MAVTLKLPLCKCFDIPCSQTHFMHSNLSFNVPHWIQLSSFYFVFFLGGGRLWRIEEAGSSGQNFLSVGETPITVHLLASTSIPQTIRPQCKACNGATLIPCTSRNGVKRQQSEYRTYPWQNLGLGRRLQVS